MKKKEKLKKWIIIVFGLFYLFFTLPQAVKAEVNISNQKIKKEIHEVQKIEGEKAIIIEDSQTPVAATPQNYRILLGQIVIIALGILMAGTGTYVFFIKNKIDDKSKNIKTNKSI